MANNIRFELAGDGPELSKIEKRIGPPFIENSFNLLGHLDNISTYYKRLDIYVNTSVHEGIPMSTLEAMPHGLPVVAPKFVGIVKNNR